MKPVGAGGPRERNVMMTKVQSYVVTCQAEADLVPSVVEGDLTVTVPVTMPQLVSVVGWLDVRSLTSADGAFPALTSVGGWLDARSLTSADGAFPALTSVGGWLWAHSLTSAEHAAFAARIGAQ